MPNESDIYAIPEFEAYLQLMEESARDWVRERLSDDEFMTLYHTRFYRCVHLAEDDPENPPAPEIARRIEELLEHFRGMRRFLSGIEQTIREYRAYGFSEADLLQKVAVLGRCLTEANFEYRPLRVGRQDPLPPPAPSSG